MKTKAALSLLLLLLSNLLPSPAGALNGGTRPGSDTRQTGIVRITTYDGTTMLGSCTATVVFSSVSAGTIGRTWLVTAGHCFSSIHSPPYYVHGHAQTPRATVRFQMRIDGEWRTVESNSADSRVFVHPEWRSKSGWDSWFGPRDLAFIRLNIAIPVYDENDVRIEEYRRPIYTGPAAFVSEPFSSTTLESYGRNVFCGYGDVTTLGCDTLSSLWWSPNFRNTFLQLPAGSWDDGFYEGGDSGGPLIKYAPGMTRQWQGSGTVVDAASHGAVIAVLQGPTVWCDYIQNGHCRPEDGLATHFEGQDAWIRGLASGQGAEIPRLQYWNMNGLFSNGLGTAGDLTASASGAYTFPFYAGKVVGVAVGADGRVNTWLDNGYRMIGTRSDLDAYSQMAAPWSNVLPTLTYSGAPGKAHRSIVGISMSPQGTVFTYYDDGTMYFGSISDLDSIGGPYAWTPAAGKTIADVVAIAHRSNGGVIAYYADGTFSSGHWYRFDAYTSPVPFEVGNGRRPDEILDLDRAQDGSTVTLFEHPRL